MSSFDEWIGVVAVSVLIVVTIFGAIGYIGSQEQLECRESLQKCEQTGQEQKFEEIYYYPPKGCDYNVLCDFNGNCQHIYSNCNQNSDEECADGWYGEWESDESHSGKCVDYGNCLVNVNECEFTWGKSIDLISDEELDICRKFQGQCDCLCWSDEECGGMI